MANVVIASTSRDVPSSHLYFCGGRDDEAESAGYYYFCGGRIDEAE